MLRVRNIEFRFLIGLVFTITFACTQELTPKIEVKNRTWFIFKNRDLFHNNRDLERNGDTLKFLHYQDTLAVFGPSKYISHGGASGNNTFYNTSLKKTQGLSTKDFIAKLRQVRETFCRQSLERCSDESEYYREELNLAVIEAYYCFKEGSIVRAMDLCTDTSHQYTFSSRKQDLMIAILLKMYDRAEIELALEELTVPYSSSIEIKGITFNWESVSDYHYAEYNDINWSKYFTTVMDNIERYGV